MSYRHYLRFTLLLFVICCRPGSPLYGQVSAPDLEIDRSYNGLNFMDLVRETEVQYGLTYYFFPGWVSELRVIQNETPTTLRAILESTLAETDYRYFINDQKQVILTMGDGIRQDFAQLDPAVLDPAPAPAVPVGQQVQPFETEWTIIGDPAAPEQKPRVALSGFVRSGETGSPLGGAIIYVEELQRGTTTDSLGYYQIALPQGRYRIVFQSVGLKETVRNVQLFAGGQVDVSLGALILDMEEVVVQANRRENIRSTQMGVEALKVETIKQLPALLGEVDVVRSALMLPGVQTVGEFSSGINVRGGGSDQNLILLNGAPVYNASHLFGFSSSFSPDVIEGFELYKSTIPARFGGRISSVLDLEMKAGDLKEWSVRGGISPVTSRITVDGPLVKDRSSLIISGRSTYSDWILRRIRDASFRNSRANYYDLTTRYNTRIGQNDQLDASLYLSNDAFQLNGDTTFGYQNRNAVVNYRKEFSEKLFGTFSGIYSHYRFRVGSEARPARGFDLSYQIDHLEGRAHFSYAPSDQHQLNFGLNLVNYRLDPGQIAPNRPESLIVPRQLERERALEGSIYLSDEWTVSEAFSLQAGLRYTHYAFLGPKTVYRYRADAARTEANLIDSVAYAGGALVQDYGGPEYRLAMRYALSPRSSLKAAFNRNRQYISMLFNSASVSPTATWKLSDTHIRPQTGDQLSLGFFQNMWDERLEFSLELYYKWIRNMVEYKAGADLLLNEQLETDVVNGDGRAYGVEVLFRKNGRKLNGWMSYTYSRTQMRADSPYPEDRINRGDWFPTNFDKPHDFSFVAFYRISRRFSFSSNVAYSTGRPITIPVAKYQYAGGVRLQYSQRNEFRVPDYFRWDLSVNIEGNHKLKKLAHSSWSVSVYNLTGRQNAYSIYFVSDGTDARGYQLSIFGRPFLTLTYNFRI